MNDGIPILIGTFRRDPDMLTDALRSIDEHVTGVGPIFFVDDSGVDPDTPDGADWMAFLKSHGVVGHRAPNPVPPWGFTGAMRVANQWMSHLRTFMAEDYFCWWEEDFTAIGRIDLQVCAETLARHPDLAQLAFARQPLYDEEKAAGGVIEYLGYERRLCPFAPGGGILVQDKVFTTNPAIWAPSAYREEWPDVKESEAAKTAQLREAGMRFGYIAGHRVQHHGELKTGVGY